MIECAVLSSLRFNQANTMLVSQDALCTHSEIIDVFQDCDDGAC